MRPVPSNSHPPMIRSSASPTPLAKRRSRPNGSLHPVHLERVTNPPPVPVTHQLARHAERVAVVVSLLPRRWIVSGTPSRSGASADLQAVTRGPAVAREVRPAQHVRIREEIRRQPRRQRARPPRRVAITRWRSRPSRSCTAAVGLRQEAQEGRVRPVRACIRRIARLRRGQRVCSRKIGSGDVPRPVRTCSWPAAMFACRLFMACLNSSRNPFSTMLLGCGERPPGLEAVGADVAHLDRVPLVSAPDAERPRLRIRHLQVGSKMFTGSRRDVRTSGTGRRRERRRSELARVAQQQ